MVRPRRQTYRSLELSPDGKCLALHRHEGNGGDTWISDLGKPPILRLNWVIANLTDHMGFKPYAVSPDGQRFLIAR